VDVDSVIRCHSVIRGVNMGWVLNIALRQWGVVGVLVMGMHHSVGA
jgi:hypothetical protein